MSYDFALQKICSHQVVLEAAQIDSATKSYIYFAQPPSSNNVSLYIDGFKIPSSGLHSYPSLPFFKSEPYRIVAGVSDLLYISIGFNTPQIIQLISGNTVKASDLVKDLQRKVPGLTWEVVNRRVVASAPSGVYTAFSFPDPRWSDKTQSLPSTNQILGAYSALGIVPGRSVNGRKLYPGWAISQDPLSTDPTTKVIKLDSPLPNNNPLIQVSYTTDVSSCRRCHGTKIEYDYNILNNTYESVSGVDLLSQEFDKYLFTRIGSHFKWNWLGSSLIDKIGSKGTTAAVTVNSLISVDIARAFQNYQNVKMQQEQRFPFQQISDAEYPLSLGGINVQVPPQDPTIAVVTTTVISRSRVPTPLQRIVGNPSPFTELNNPTQFLLRG